MYELEEISNDLRASIQRFPRPSGLKIEAFGFEPFKRIGWS